MLQARYYSMITKEQEMIVRKWKSCKKLATEITSLRASMKRISVKIEKKEDLLSLLEDVTEVVDGVPISVMESKNFCGIDSHFYAVADEAGKIAEVYPNAHTCKNGKAKTWGIRINENSNKLTKYRWLGDLFLGAHFRPRKKALEIAKRWVVEGIVDLPDDKYKSEYK